LVELRLHRHTIEEKRIEGHPVGLGEAREDGIEGLGVVAPQIARRQHACEQHGDALGLEAVQDGVQVPVGLGRVDAAQSVVGAQLDDRQVRAVRERPIEPRQAGGRGIAGIAAIQDLDPVAFALERPLQLDGEGLVRGQAVAVCQAVAERQDAQRRGLGGAQRHRRKPERERQRPTQGT
jgi:hypothetical protein